MNIKEQIEQRLKDLKGSEGKEKQGALIEATAAKMVIDDLLLCSAIAEQITGEAPTVAEVMSINQLYQAYIAPAYQTLITRGELAPPAVQTNNSSAVKSKDEWDS